MQQQMDLFVVLMEMNAIDKIKSEIDSLKEFDYIQTSLCTVEKAKELYVVKTNDFEECFRNKNELLEFVERGSAQGWDFVYELQQ